LGAAMRPLIKGSRSGQAGGLGHCVLETLPRQPSSHDASPAIQAGLKHDLSVRPRVYNPPF
jgi:hypothetical protein